MSQEEIEVLLEPKLLSIDFGFCFYTFHSTRGEILFIFNYTERSDYHLWVLSPLLSGISKTANLPSYPQCN